MHCVGGVGETGGYVGKVKLENRVGTAFLAAQRRAGKAPDSSNAGAALIRLPAPSPRERRGEGRSSNVGDPSPRLLRGEGKGEGQHQPTRLSCFASLHSWASLGPTASEQGSRHAAHLAPDLCRRAVRRCRLARPVDRRPCGAGHRQGVSRRVPVPARHVDRRRRSGCRWRCSGWRWWRRPSISPSSS